MERYIHGGWKKIAISTETVRDGTMVFFLLWSHR